MAQPVIGCSTCGGHVGANAPELVVVPMVLEVDIGKRGRVQFHSHYVLVMEITVDEFDGREGNALGGVWREEFAHTSEIIDHAV